MKYKIITSFMALGILSFLVSGYSLAYFTSNIEDNDLTTFNSHKVKIGVEKGSDRSLSCIDYVEKRNLQWEIKNEGTTDIRLKVKVIESGNDRRENIELKSGNRWKQGSDGDFYYADLVTPGKTADFPLEVSFKGWKTIKDYGINIEAEAIQASNNAIDDEWPNHSN